MPEFTGIDGATGEPLPGPQTVEEFADWVHEPPLDVRSKRNFRWLLEEYGEEDKLRGTIYKDSFHKDINIHDLASAGYAVVLAPGLPQAVLDNLQPLLEMRKKQAGDLFKQIVYRTGQSKFDFLDALGVPQGPADPSKLPYYVLLVGGPDGIPFDFQYELDVEYAVGRICFDTPQEYAQYAQNVKAAESGDPLPPRKVGVFGASTDDVTERTARDLTLALGDALKAHGGEGWSVQSWTAQEADKPLLGRLLGGERAPALVIASGHGLAFPSGHPRQRSMQGGLVCREGTEEDPGDEYFTASDLRVPGDLTGSMVCLFACYSAGTPDVSSFPESALSLPPSVAPKPFCSALAQQLLAQGALAVLGHIDRMWTMAFSWSDKSQIQPYQSTLEQVMDGYRIGAATEFINARYVSFAVQHSQLAEARQNLIKVDRDRFVRALQGKNDARNFVVFGDPAVRLTWRKS